MGTVAETLQMFDNHDERIWYQAVRMERPLTDIREIPLPEGYAFRNYVPGDRDVWIGIELSAREFRTREEGLDAWNRYFAAEEESLRERMFFVTDRHGQCVATASAYFDIEKGDDGHTGWLHWVAVRRASQGLGLAKPLVTRVLARMRELGYENAVVPTQTTTWLACKLYMDLGFRPTEESLKTAEAGWRIIRRLTGHPALEGIECASEEEVLNGPQKAGTGDGDNGVTLHRVQYYETDMMGIVHHANYLHWMEEARIQFMDAMGFPYADMEKKGVVSPVRAVSCRYMEACTFSDEIEIRTWPEAFNGVVLTMRYEMRRRGQENPVCTATSEHVFLNRSGGFIRMKRDMPEFVTAMEKAIREHEKK